MPQTVIFAVRLILPDTILDNAWITFDNGTITDFGQGPPPQTGNSVYGLGVFLAPGFIDTHVHGGNGSDFLDATPEAFSTISGYHLSQGTTALCPTLATTTYERIAAVLDVWSNVKDTCSARILPVHLEGPHLASTKAGAQDPKLLRSPTDVNVTWLINNASRIAQMTIAPELPNALQLIERCRSAGIIMSAGHTEAREEPVRTSISHGLTKVTHLFNAMTYAAKNGLFREPGLAEYALIEDRLACELIADGFHVAPTLMKLAVRSKGPAKLALISDALAGTGLPVGSTFMLGSLPCRVAQGFCELADGSALAGSATTLIDQVRIMHQVVDVPLADAVRMATRTPASLLGLDHRYGSIARGCAADFVQFDTDLRVQSVWVAGRRLGPPNGGD
ncbi:MAG: N-acetylglucosamine-6-phosphate deacetylase [Bryobacteraceae bacterium]